MPRLRVLTASYRPLVLMSSSMPDRRRVSLAPVNTLAPSGIRSLMRVRAAAASSRISTVKPGAVSAAAARSRRSAGAGSMNSVAGIGVVMVPPWAGRGVAGRRAQVVPDRRGPVRGAVTWLRVSGRRACQRSGVEVPDLVDALGELPPVAGALVAVVVDGVVQPLTAVAGAGELLDVGPAGRGGAVQLDRTRIGGLHEELPLGLQPLAPGADLIPADQFGGDVGHPQRTVGCEQRREAGAVAHHRRVGELAAQRLDLDAVRDSLKVTHRFPLICCVCVAVIPSPAVAPHQTPVQYDQAGRD